MKPRMISTISAAAAGTMVAQNAARGTCACSRGDGTYYEAPCT